MTDEIIKVVEGQIVQSTELALLLSDLTQQSKAIVIHDSQTYADALEVCKRGSDAIKFVLAAAEPERMRLQRAKDELIAKRDRIIATITTAYDGLERNARQWNLNEKAAAQREQDRINAANRAAAEQFNKGKRQEKRIPMPTPVHVAPSIPTVPGKRMVDHYRFEVLDAKKIKKEFFAIDDVKIGAKCRSDKNPKKSEQEIGPDGGIRVWVE